MFDNIGSKIKTAARVLAWIGIIGAWIGAFVLWGMTADAYDEEKTLLVVIGLVVGIVGSLISLIGAFTLYGFGELVDNSAIIADNSAAMIGNHSKSADGFPQSNTQGVPLNVPKNIPQSAPKSFPHTYPPTSKQGLLQSLLSKALITEEEYQHKSSELERTRSGGIIIDSNTIHFFDSMLQTLYKKQSTGELSDEVYAQQRAEALKHL